MTLSYPFRHSRLLGRALVAALALACAASPAQAQARSNKSDIAASLNVFNSLYKELQTNYVDSIDAKKTIRNAIDYMLAEIDPYTEYFPREEQDQFRSIATGEYGGIGCTIVQRDGRVVLYNPLWDSPSRAAGVMHGDVLLAIDGDTLPAGYSTADASARLRGTPGTVVRLSVRRPWTQDSLLDIAVTRGKVRTTPVPYYGILPSGVGYIGLTTFNEKSAQQVRQALLELKKDPRLKGLILDLRGNGGGLLESAVQIAGLFVPKGTEIVRTRYRDRANEKVYRTTQSPVDTELPLAVMVNRGTASSSEIVAGALQDLDRAVIVGERSYGKGLVQTSRPLPYDGILKVTVARYYIPSGRLIQAIDYTHRNEDGSPARIPDSLTRVYHTAAGREVRDGGGISPDIAIPAPAGNRLLYNIAADFWAHDYANRFRQRAGASIGPAADWAVSDSVFADFKAFIDPARFKYDRACETGVSRLREVAQAEGYMTDSVAAVFAQLEGLLRHDLGRDLDHNKAQLVKMLDAEISSRYFSDSDCTMRSVLADPDVEQAAAALTDTARYRAILRKE